MSRGSSISVVCVALLFRRIFFSDLFLRSACATLTRIHRGRFVPEFVRVHKAGHRERGPSRLRDKNATKDTLDSGEHGRGDPRGMQRRYRGECLSYLSTIGGEREREREYDSPETPRHLERSRTVSPHASNRNVVDMRNRRREHNARYLSLYKVKHYAD